MPVGDRTDPYRVHGFIVELDGIARAGFRECSGLDASNDADRVSRGDRRSHDPQAPGDDEVRKRHAPLGHHATMWSCGNGGKKAADGMVERKNGSIVLLDEGGRGEGAVELRRGVADEVDRPELQRDRERGRDRDARARPRRADQSLMLQTEFPFTLPRGFVDAEGDVHSEGVMRLATAYDEVAPLKDPRVQRQPGIPGDHPALAGDHPARLARGREPQE